MASWARAWDLLTHGHAVREVEVSNPDCGTIIEDLDPVRQLASFAPPNMPSIVDSKFVYN